MRRVYRTPLNEEAARDLCERTCEVAKAGWEAKKLTGRFKARKAMVEKLWANTGTRPFQHIRGVLQEMAPEPSRCMYCDIAKGNEIEHFWPKERYHGRAFLWENYLWVCGECNKSKGNRFPLDEKGQPLLINPAEEEPRDHLAFSPSTGKWAGLTVKGRMTIDVLGFKRRGPLDIIRKDRFKAIQSLIVDYAAQCRQGDAQEAEAIRGLICRGEFASALYDILNIAASPGAQVLRADCRDAIQAHPKIRTWLPGPANTPSAHK